jgi:Acetyltransferase (GNAT) domain
MEIRDAVAEDAPAACEVLRRSISELCVADHGNDPTILARWLGNKTPEIVASWITQTGNTMLVAVEGSAILGMGSVTDKGEINLNYVSPDARFRGVSRALWSHSKHGQWYAESALHAHQHRDSASLLSFRRLYRRRPPTPQVWDMG